jgi:CBS domain-containing protein
MSSQFSWNNRLISSQELILEELIPMARIGLQRSGINDEDIDKYLSVIQKRVSSKNGSEWIVKSYRSLSQSKKRNEANQVLTANLYINQERDIPVSEWEILPSDATTTFNIKKKVLHIMNTSIISVEKNDPLELVVNIMKWKNIHHMPVIKGDKELIGLLTWTDIKKYLDQPKEIKLSVKQIMKTEVITISEDKNIDDASQLMAKFNINCLPVTKGNKLVGIVTSNDI